MAAPARVDIGTLIQSDPEIWGGRPCIAGTRISVQAVASLFKDGLSAGEIAEEYPHVPAGHIHAAVAFYLANSEEIDGYLADDRRLHDEIRALTHLARAFADSRPEP